MGGGSWTTHDWDDFKTSATVDKKTGKTKSKEEIFDRHSINPAFDPAKITVRESVDSPDNPESTPVIVALDVTGSMGVIPDALVKDGLGTMATEIITRKPVSDPHIMFMAVGDAAYDEAPLQATQFEADIRIAEQLKELYLEGGGGGNQQESYHLPWYLAARKTQIDSFDKRGQKGYLFTMGDEGVPPTLTRAHVKEVFGDDIQEDIKTEDLLRMVEERYEVFHLIIQEGSNYRYNPDYVKGCWKDLLGERAIPVADYRKVPEIIVSTLQVMAGIPKHEVEASWDGSTALVVSKAIAGLVPTGRGGAVAAADKGAPGGGVWRPGAPGGPGGA
jgi:hypothetical protein